METVWIIRFMCLLCDYLNDYTASYETPQFLACQLSRLFLAVGASTTQYHDIPPRPKSCFASHVLPARFWRQWPELGLIYVVLPCGLPQYDLVTPAPHV